MSKRIGPLLFSAATLAAALLLAPAAQAICNSARLFNSGSTYVITPGCEAADCGAAHSSVTDAVSGRFWALGDGDPALGAGIDNGSFEALFGWLYTPVTYPALIAGTWAASSGIDGCIDFAADQRRCMAVQLSDISPATGTGAMTVITAQPDNLGNYDLSGSGDYFLAEVPRPVILSTYQADVCAGTLDPCAADSDCPEGVLCEWEAARAVVFRVDGDLGGLYEAPECVGPTPIVAGYRLFQQHLPSGTPAPTNPSIDEWEALSDVVPLGEPVNAILPCGPSSGGSVFVAAALVFDGGFQTSYLSGPTSRLECASTLADPDPITPHKPRNRERPRDRGREVH